MRLRHSLWTLARDVALVGTAALALESLWARWRPLLTRLGRCFAATSRYGGGRVAVISDRAFLTNRNLEGQTASHPEDSRWLTGLIRAGVHGRGASGHDL